MTCVILLVTLLAGCVTVTCDPDDPKIGKDCYECTRQAKFRSQEIERRTDKSVNLQDLAEECLRERGYTKEKR